MKNLNAKMRICGIMDLLPKGKAYRLIVYG